MENKKYNILIVDDTPENLKVLGLLLNEYNVKIAINGQKCLEVVSRNEIDLILLDVMMPVLDGYETCKILKENDDTKNIPIIFLTAKNCIKDEENGLALGAIDFLTKPISPAIVKARVKTHLENTEYRKFLENKSKWLENEVEKKLSQINKLQEATLIVMISLAEFRDEETGNHIKRTQEFIAILATKLSGFEKYRDILNLGYINNLIKSAPLHDIGKVAIPDNILLKPGKLDDEELIIMRTHPVRGLEILNKAKEYLKEDSDFLTIASEIVGSHHEKWDGTGYPKGLKEDEIPLSARLMALADVYDALTSSRPYKKTFSHKDATDFITVNKYLHFDPEIVDVFLDSLQEFESISAKYSDKDNC
jgi:putative two-component system response regulator